MSITKTLGGERVGSGNRMKQNMHGFARSNKNLSASFRSTMAPGVLYPCYTNIALDGDTFDIDLRAFVRTIPTIGPLYGSFKLQIDVYRAPFRLYQGILHNNTLDIARHMNQVYLPKILLGAKVKGSEYKDGFAQQISHTSLMKYVNISGLGKPNVKPEDDEYKHIDREFLAIPTLAYYDIFKNYYANKQEENAYVITPNIKNTNQNIEWIALYESDEVTNKVFTLENEKETLQGNSPSLSKVVINGVNLDPELINISFKTSNNEVKGTLKDLEAQGKIELTGDSYMITVKRLYSTDVLVKVEFIKYKESSGIHLEPFELSNIDDMRKYLLTQWDLGTKTILHADNPYCNQYPYRALFAYESTRKFANQYPLNGLVVKCYQSDLFNNWLDTEWVNEITNTSSIDVSSGSFTLDTLNFKKKLYDHLNRIAISGGTYDDWQEVTYGNRVWGKAEKPIYCGGYSSEIMFDEVVSTAASQDQPLGTIGGQGMMQSRNDASIKIKVNEASVIMAIVSITPRLCYSQGNAWYNTDLDTMDDLHKPIFDRIGFQDLMVEQMAWWDASVAPTGLGPDGEPIAGLVTRNSAGKQPAWMNYATDIDRAYGDFADTTKKGLNYMVITRNYEQDEDGDVKDVTTYIDPSKYNYAFVYQQLDAQNFWTFITFKVFARRHMSNTQIPNV